MNPSTSLNTNQLKPTKPFYTKKVIEPLEDGTKYLVALGDGDWEEIMTYNEILNFVENQMSEGDNDYF